MSKAPKGLKSRLTSYGDAGFALFLRQAFLEIGRLRRRGARPAGGWHRLHRVRLQPCHATAPQVIEAVKRGVLAAGGLPFVFPTISLHESFCSPTTMLHAQPDGDRRRGDGARATPGCRGAHRRLRQDRAGADHGRAVGRRADADRGGRRGAGRHERGRAARRLHRLPPPVGACAAPSEITDQQIGPGPRAA